MSNGFNDAERIDLVKKCGGELRSGQPHNVDVTKEKPDVWYDPAVAPVLQVEQFFDFLTRFLMSSFLRLK